jgi:hypothetical protein
MTVVGILGVIHDNSSRIKYGLTLELIEELILEFRPDVICGEVLPTSWERYLLHPNDKGYWGEPASEYGELIFPLCEQKNIEFIPVDWVELDVCRDFDPFRKYSTAERDQLKRDLLQWDEKLYAVCNQSQIPFNSQLYDEITRAKYKWLEKLDPEVHLFRWLNRHLIMIQRIKNAIVLHDGKRLLCIAGAAHNHCYYEGLLTEPIELIYPLRGFGAMTG